VQIFPVLPQVDDWVAYQLAGSMERHVTSPLDLEDLDTPLGQFGGVQLESPRPSAPAQRDDGLVFYQEQKILPQLTLNALAAKPSL